MAQAMDTPSAASKAQNIMANRPFPKQKVLSAMSTYLRDEMGKQEKLKVL